MNTETGRFIGKQLNQLNLRLYIDCIRFILIAAGMVTVSAFAKQLDNILLSIQSARLGKVDWKRSGKGHNYTF
uniref:Uncharacterized protein n=1 Tax=Pararge aegeria TaxID=116150 RepID=S4PEK9_9NEOP